MTLVKDVIESLFLSLRLLVPISISGLSSALVCIYLFKPLVR